MAKVEYRGQINTTLDFPEHHLHYISFELVKNALRATAETAVASGTDMPPVCVTIAEGGDDVTIQIADQGGGMSRQKVLQPFAFCGRHARWI